LRHTSEVPLSWPGGSLGVTSTLNDLQDFLELMLRHNWRVR
jgi:hypothetical protein